jgi:hypothetical protein
MYLRVLLILTLLIMKWELLAVSVFGQGSERPVKPAGQLFILKKVSWPNVVEKMGGHGRLLLLSYPTFLSTHLMDCYYT